MNMLGDYISIKHGYAFKGEGITTEDNGVVLVTPGNFAIGGGFKEDKCKFFVGEYPTEYVLLPDDLIVTMTDLSKEMDTLGYSALVPDSNRVYLHNQRIGLIKFLNNNLDKHFLYWYMRTRNYQRTIAGGASGTTVHHTSPNRICEVEVNFPDIVTQKRIANVLDNIERIIGVNAKINQNLQAQAFALFDSLISQNDCELCTLDQIADLNPKRQLSKGTVAKCIDMSQLSTSGAFPAGWEMKPFNGGMRFTNGDTILARITPCLENGKTAYINFLNDSEVAFGSTEYIVISTKGIYPPEFFYCLARYSSFVEYAVKNMNGSSGRQRVSADLIGKYQLPVITQSAIESFKNSVPAMFEIMKNNSLENKKLSELRDTLLPKLMSGELDVSELAL